MADPITIGGIISGIGALAGAGAGLLNKPKAPRAAPTPVAPTADDEEIQRARRRRAALARQESGVRSSVLTRPGGRETLG